MLTLESIGIERGVGVRARLCKDYHRGPGQEEVSTRFEEGHGLRVGVLSDPFRMSISMSIVN